MSPSIAGDLPPFGSAKKMRARQFFAEFMRNHNSSLMALLRTAENFAVNEVAPSVQRDLNNAATLGQVENVNDRTEESSESGIMDQDSGMPSQ